MNKNSNLHKAKEKKNDEFYTQLSDIENELRHYKQHFRGKVVYCNCDDPYESNFFKYFAMNFNSLGLKKLIATGYATSPVAGKELSQFEDEVGTPKNQSYAVYINKVTDLNGDGRIDLEDIKILLKGNIALDDKGMPIQITVKKPCFDEEGNPILDRKGNQKTESVKQDLYYEAGDFRSDESIILLKQADIVVTNPPFSLFREYVHQLMEYDKKFLIIGNMNAITYKEIFPLLKDDTLWLGYMSPKIFIYKDGTKRQFGNILWYTNLDIPKRHEILDLYKEYNPEDYPKYDNYDAININKVSDIPMDYDGVMGVPITFLSKYNPEQFEILGITLGNTIDYPMTFIYENSIQHNKDGTIQGGSKVNTRATLLVNEKPKNIVYYTANDVEGYLLSIYPRILIRKRKSVVSE